MSNLLNTVLVIDYGMGNLRSVSKALEHLGAKVKVSGSPRDIAKAEKLVLPGVGAFGNAVKELKARKIFRPLQDYLSRGGKFLGICLGLQLLFERSEESPKVKGLAALEGKVLRFRSKNVKIPHMGWNQVILRQHPLLKGLKSPAWFYFVHSYYAAARDKSLNLGVAQYGKESFCAILGNETIFATQFHPEKSQQAGLRILKNFISWR